MNSLEVLYFNHIPDPLIKYDFENVYSPSDDSYLLINYFKKNLGQTHFDGLNLSEIKYILDLGTGTGIIAIFLQLIKNQNPNFKANIVASDILEEAIRCAKENESLNNIKNQIKFIQSDLFKDFPEDLHHAFNIIIFNPPYLPSSRNIKEDNKRNIDLSWDGGLNGFEIFIEFLKNASFFLNLEEDHYIYSISSSRSKLTALDKQINALGYKKEIVDQKHIFFEDIFLNRLSYK